MLEPRLSSRESEHRYFPVCLAMSLAIILLRIVQYWTATIGESVQHEDGKTLNDQKQE